MYIGWYNTSTFYPELGHALLICVTETKNLTDFKLLSTRTIQVTSYTTVKIFMLIFELRQPGRTAKAQIPSNLQRNKSSSLPENLLRKTKISLPEVSELQVVRHFTRLSLKNFCIDTHFYPF